jgi:hypothetical protein
VVGGHEIRGRRYSAAGVAGAEFLVGMQIAGESGPAIFGQRTGGFVVAWPSDDGDAAGVFARRFTSDAVSVGGAFRANTRWAGNQTQPSVAAFDDGGFLVAWTSQGQDGSGLGVYAQMFDSTGTRVNAEFRLNTTVVDHQLSPAVAALSGGTFVAAWTSGEQDGSLKGVYGQRFRFAGP